jgi:hypothetical protein
VPPGTPAKLTNATSAVKQHCCRISAEFSGSMLADEDFAPKETIATICECLPEKWFRGGGERAAIETPVALGAAWGRPYSSSRVGGTFFVRRRRGASRSVNPLHKRAGTLMRFQ